VQIEKTVGESLQLAIGYLNDFALLASCSNSNEMA